jgi:hypothetical protein
MLDTRPKENESLSWLWVGLWTMLILATIPLARAIASRLEDSAGTAVFLWLTAGTIVAALLVALRALARRQLALGAYIGLTVFGGALLGVAWHLRGNPVEAFHLVQYGILSVLIYRALLHRCSDNSIYLLSAVLTGSVGILDEWIQWLIPERYWGFRDVVINFTAAVLAQGLLASGLRPKLIRGWPSGDSLRRLCFGVATFLGMLCLSFANTPDRIAWYAERIPGASFLLDSQSMMVEYGYRYEDPDIGVFRSRFNDAELTDLDRIRGAEVARILDGYRGDGDWNRFRQIYTVPRDAYVHETGTHLFRRNRHLILARDPSRPDWKRRDSYFIAQRENRILEKYFPTAIGQSSHHWNTEVRQEVDAAAFAKQYESAVSRSLMTNVGRHQVVTGFLIVIVASIVAGILAGRDMSKQGQRAKETESS